MRKPTGQYDADGREICVGDLICSQAGIPLLVVEGKDGFQAITEEERANHLLCRHSLFHFTHSMKALFGVTYRVVGQVN